MDNYTWTVGGTADADGVWAPDRFGEELAESARKLLPSATQAHVTIQDRDLPPAAVDDKPGSSEVVQAVIEVETSEHWPPLDDFHAYLRGIWRHVQGWQVKPTLIFDTRHPRELGEPSVLPSILVFVQRLDGTTPEHFHRNWYIHAGHPDGQEAESEASLAERHREESEGPDRIYRQNRVIEAITPTTWLVHGYTQLQLGFSVPEVPSEQYPRVRGEEDFDRWPPRMVQGFEYRIL